MTYQGAFAAVAFSYTAFWVSWWGPLPPDPSGGWAVLPVPGDIWTPLPVVPTDPWTVT